MKKNNNRNKLREIIKKKICLRHLNQIKNGQNIYNYKMVPIQFS